MNMQKDKKKNHDCSHCKIFLCGRIKHEIMNNWRIELILSSLNIIYSIRSPFVIPFWDGIVSLSKLGALVVKFGRRKKRKETASALALASKSKSSNFFKFLTSNITLWKRFLTQNAYLRASRFTSISILAPTRSWTAEIFSYFSW